MPREVFVDTSGWGEIAHKDQPYYVSATRIYTNALQQGHRLITTNYIIAELVALLNGRMHMPHQAIVQFIDQVRASPSVEIVFIDLALDEQAWQLLKARPDKEWSLVDCTSFVLMQRRRIIEALTTDRHFEQAGLVRLLP